MKNIKAFNVITFVIVLIINGLANILPLNGYTTGGVTKNIPSLFTPAAYVFAIWGVIYLSSLGFVIYQSRPAQADNQRLKRIGPWFIIVNLSNSAWIFFWHYRLFGLSQVAMLSLLTSLIIIYIRLGVGQQTVSWKEKLFVDMPFSIYLGWISVATIANTGILLIVNNWNTFGIAPEIWAVIVLLVGTALGIAMTLLRREVAYPLVIIWSFIGIVNARPDVLPVAVIAGIGAGIVFLVLLISRLGSLAKRANAQ